MSGFIEKLERLNEVDTRVRAVLRRSLAFDPGAFVPAFPYVEPFLREEPSLRQREIFYLVAGLWAAHWRAGRAGERQPIAAACASYKHASGSSSIERRFIALLDADADQLPHRLRQMVALLKDYPLDFESLLRDLLYWNDDRKRTQNAWARGFYRSLDTQAVPELESEEENRE